MNQKNVSMVVLSVLVILLAGVIVYMNYNKQSAPTDTSAPVSNNTTSSNPTTMQPSFVYDMANISTDTNPCTGKSSPADQGEQGVINKAYNSLINKDYTGVAASISNSPENSLFGYAFGVCSSAHTSLAAIPYKNGVALLIFQGNGYPSIPNDSYYFGFLTASDNKILLYQGLIKNFFDKTTGDEYLKASKEANSSDSPGVELASIQKNIESKIINEFKAGSFKNKDLQNEYNQFITQF